MGIVTEKIKEIQAAQNLTLTQVFEKYPFLAELQHEEILQEQGKAKGRTNKINEKQLKTTSILQLGAILTLVYVGVKLFNLK